MNDRLREIEGRAAALELGREIDLDGLRDCYIQDVRHLLVLLGCLRQGLAQSASHTEWLRRHLGD